jgi:hypothetical protein
MLVPPLDNRIGLKVEADTTDWVIGCISLLHSVTSFSFFLSFFVL